MFLKLFGKLVKEKERERTREKERVSEREREDETGESEGEREREVEESKRLKTNHEKVLKYRNQTFANNKFGISFES